MFGYLGVLSKCELDRGLHGLSGVGIIHGMVGLWVVLKLEWNPLHPGTSPAKSAGLFSLLKPPFHLSPLLSFFFFFFGSDFATTSSSSSTPATASTSTPA